MSEKIQVWWSGLAPREHALLAMAAGLSFVFLFGFGVLTPILRAQSDTATRLQAVTTEHLLIQRGIERLQANSSGVIGGVEDFDGFRLLVAESAKENGLSITRLQATQGGGLQIILDTADPLLLYAWLNQLSAQPGGIVTEATLEGREGGQVQAVIELSADSI